MKKSIWKFSLDFEDKTTLQMPKGAEILSVNTQGENARIWALVDPSQETEERYFEMYGTGHDIYCDMGIERKFIGTIQIYNGTLIFHVFERIN